MQCNRVSNRSSIIETHFAFVACMMKTEEERIRERMKEISIFALSKRTKKREKDYVSYND